MSQFTTSRRLGKPLRPPRSFNGPTAPPPAAKNSFAPLVLGALAVGVLLVVLLLQGCTSSPDGVSQFPDATPPTCEDLLRDGTAISAHDHSGKLIGSIKPIESCDGDWELTTDHTLQITTRRIPSRCVSVGHFRADIAADCQ